DRLNLAADRGASRVASVARQRGLGAAAAARPGRRAAGAGGGAHPGPVNRGPGAPRPGRGPPAPRRPPDRGRAGRRAALLRVARWSGYPLWQYEFGQAPVGAIPVLPGAFHAAALLYLFSSVLGVPLPWTGDSAVFAERMRRWWTDFAHTGDPNGHGSPRWPAWPRRDDPRADGPVLTTRAEGSAVSDDFAARHHCSFWDELSR